MKKILHFISHSHWDREWYMSFEQHRIRLVEMMDKLFETFESKPDFKFFHLDGQIIVLEDYLEIKPYMLEKVKKYVGEGKLKIGPWYVLQDEYLISGEANVRNMLYGFRLAEKFGPVSMIGYFPDAFGNISQLPQLVKGFGIDNIVFGRGIYPIGFESKVFDEIEDYTSEVVWRGPDGSETIGILFANWYHNANEIPSDKASAVQHIQKIRDNAAKVAKTPHLLMMNGSDHQPVQDHIGDILNVVKDEFTDILLHGNLEDYVAEIRHFKSELPVIEGEICGQKTNGHGLLVNTASSRMYLKQMNHQTQNLLEKWVEPLGVMSWLCGDEYRADFILQSWKYLLQNHPHDSICGCSVDDVHDEMVTRFKKSAAIAGELINRESDFLVSKIDTSMLGKDEIPVVVFNPLNWNLSDRVTLYVDFEENDPATPEGISITDCHGKSFAADVKALGRTFTYSLPNDSFRKVRYVKRFEVSFRCHDIPPFGYKTFKVVRNKATIHTDLICGETFAENRYLRVELQQNGALRVINKENGHVFDGLNLFEDVGDIGDEYNFIQTADVTGITTEVESAEWSVENMNSSYVTFKAQLTMKLPAGADKQTGARSSEKRSFKVCSFVTLEESSRRIDIRTVFDNVVKDHRLRALFPTGLHTDFSYADGQFDIVKRSIKPWEGWENPSNCHRQQAFVDLYDGINGVVIANKGLPEYEVLRDEQNTLALTLVRSVGEMGDWGIFPAPGAQCPGIQEVEYSIIPYAGDNSRVEAYRCAYQFQIVPVRAVQGIINKGCLPLEKSFFCTEGNNIVMSALKKSEDRDSVIMRVYNTSDKPQNFIVKLDKDNTAVYETNLNEQRTCQLEIKDGTVEICLPQKKIATLEFVKNLK